MSKKKSELNSKKKSKLNDIFGAMNNKKSNSAAKSVAKKTGNNIKRG